MADRAEHFRKAEKLFEEAEGPGPGKKQSVFLACLGFGHALLANVSDNLAHEMNKEEQRKKANGGPKLPPWASTSHGSVPGDDDLSAQVRQATSQIMDHHYTTGGYGLCVAGIGGGELCNRPMVEHARQHPAAMETGE